MGTEVTKIIDIDKLKVRETLSKAVGKHALHVGRIWNQPGYLRAATILDTPDLSPVNPASGYGTGNTAEEAIVRALYTYRHPEETHDLLDEARYVEVSKGQILTSLRAPSRLDHIFDREEDLFLYKEDGQIVARTSFGAGFESAEPLRVVGHGALATLELLAEHYYHPDIHPDIVEDMHITGFYSPNNP